MGARNKPVWQVAAETVAGGSDSGAIEARALTHHADDIPGHDVRFEKYVVPFLFAARQGSNDDLDKTDRHQGVVTSNILSNPLCSILSAREFLCACVG